jgi:hypothetical protein
MATSSTTLSTTSTIGTTSTTEVSTPVPAPLDGEAGSPLIIGFGVLALVTLFAASFYFVVVWPKRSLLEYRRKFEALVNRDRFVGDETQLRSGKSGAGVLYAGSKPTEYNVSPITGIAKSKSIPTMAQITKAKAQREAEMAAKLRAQHDAEQEEDPDI